MVHKLTRELKVYHQEIKRKKKKKNKKETSMGSEAEEEAASTLRLPLFAKTDSEAVHYFQESPLHPTATVPFRWEEEPGKPRKCTSALSKSIQDFSHDRCLELPPRLLLPDANGTKLPSPITVLDGPYISGKSRFQSSSFRIIRRDWFFGSFRKSSTSPERDHSGSMVLKRGVKEKGLFGSFGFGRRVYQSRGDIGGYTYAFPSFMEGEADDGDDVETTRIRRAGSFTALSQKTRTHFWATIYEGLKQVIPWRSSKLKKDEIVI